MASEYTDDRDEEQGQEQAEEQEKKHEIKLQEQEVLQGRDRKETARLNRNRERTLAEETTATAKAVILRSNKPAINFQKIRNKRLNRQSHVETIETPWNHAAERVWTDPYTSNMSAVSLREQYLDM